MGRVIVEGGLDGADLEGKLTGSVTAEVCLLWVSLEWREGGSRRQSTVIPRSSRQYAKGKEEGPEIQNEGYDQHSEQAVREAP